VRRKRCCARRHSLGGPGHDSQELIAFCAATRRCFKPDLKPDFVAIDLITATPPRLGQLCEDS